MRTVKRHPNVPTRREALSEAQAVVQKQRGLYTVERGEPLAIPVDRLSDPTTFLSRRMWRRDDQGRVFRPGAVMDGPSLPWQKRALEWANEHIHRDFSAGYYKLLLGHDVHVTLRGDLYGRHWHRGWVDPFTKEMAPPLDPTFSTFVRTHYQGHPMTAGICRLDVCPAEIWPLAADAIAALGAGSGFVEDLGWLSGGKVTDAFVSEIVDELVSATGSEFADFDYHEVGTDSTAENNDHTALQVSSGIARQSGTPTDADPDYQNVATITADATETWEEHGIFNNSTGAAMMDRSLTGGQSVVSSDQVQYTYTLTVNPEA